MGDKPGEGEVLYKGAILRKVDKLLNEKDGSGHFARRPSFLAALEDINLDDENHQDAYINVLKDKQFAVEGTPLVDPQDPREEQFLRGWFDRRDFGVESVSKTLIDGTINTITAANEVNLPIDSYWLQGFGDQFMVVFSVSDYQVTRGIVTPE